MPERARGDDRVHELPVRLAVATLDRLTEGASRS